MAKYEVPIIYHGLSNFIVEADGPSEAIAKAIEMFNNGEEPAMLGNEWEIFDRAQDAMPINPLNGETDPDGDAMGRMMGKNV